MLNKTIRVGGVPEHFNLAWHLAIENNLFQNAGINIEWHDMPGGTGAMCKAIEDKQLDLVIGLTEGVISQIANGLPASILQFYVNSPLKWGIYTKYGSNIKDCSKIDGLKYAISRKFSGSHLMAKVLAQESGHQIPEENFEICGDINGAIDALEKEKAQLFMWEKFTTQPYVNDKKLQHIGNCRTPWPCFLIAGSNEFIRNNSELVKNCLQIINQTCFDLKYREQDAVEMIAWRYHLTAAQAKEWFSELEYAYRQSLDIEQLKKIVNQLKFYGILKNELTIEKIYHPMQAEMMEETW